MSSEKFCLKWNDFERNISSAFRDIREEKEFFDITLACEEEQLQAGLEKPGFKKKNQLSVFFFVFCFFKYLPRRESF
jgi:hypothetical protein